MAPVVVQNADLYWHIAAGRWMIENYAVLRIDPFSYTFTGHVWQSQGWLAQLALTGAYLATGFSGVIALVGLVAGLGAFLLAFSLSRFLQGALLWGAIALAFIVAAATVSAAPYVLALPFAVIFAAGLARARAENRRPSFYLLAAMLVWANLDASYIIGFFLALALGAEAVLAEPDLKVLRDWLVFSGYALVIGLITPYGLDGIAYAIRILVEAPRQPIFGLVPLLIGLPAFAVLVQKKATLIRAAIIAIFFVLALYSPSARLFFAFVTPLLVADTLSEKRIVPAFALKPVLALCLISVVALLARGLLPFDPPDSAIRPAAALDRVPAAMQNQPVLNETAFGGYLVSRGIRPFIDVRPLYSANFRARYDRLGDPKTLERTLRRYHIAWTLMAPGNPAVKALDGTKGWKRLYSDPYAVVHVKNEE